MVFTTSKKLYEKCSAINKNTHDFPNVVDWEHFSQAFNPGPDPEDLKDIPHPRLGYVGVLSDFKVDFELLLNIAIEKPEWHIVLIGEEREGQLNDTVQRLKKMENVHFLGYKKYDELPRYMRGLDVGLLPTLINQYTNSMFPMKYFEYLSSGLPIAATNLNFLKSIDLNGIKLVTLNKLFPEALEGAIGFKKYTIQEAFQLVNSNTWHARLNSMLSHTKSG